ncbi:MAG TPA: DUF2378 family protein [Salinisphaera sp.]|nr:DUF2378 family protein [Salinisphaera sp.]HET7313205.1 DUF2378 family protein [Salinisphaera sp.]
MKGVLFNVVEDVVSEHLGDAAWDQLLEDAGIDRGYTALGNYPETEMRALIAATAKALGHSPRQVTCWMGRRAIGHFFKRYPHYFKPMIRFVRFYRAWIGLSIPRRASSMPMPARRILSAPTTATPA